MIPVAVHLTQGELDHVAQLAAMKDQTVSDVLREAMRFTPEADIRVSRPERHLHLVETR
jgi:hypothetical protein